MGKYSGMYTPRIKYSTYFLIAEKQINNYKSKYTASLCF